MALMSPRFASGVRLLAVISASTSRLGSPARTSLTGGICRPSWKISSLTGDRLLGTRPPMSEQWMNAQP